jgi:hypothetical protein
VELFEEIRREYEFGVGTIAGTAKKLGVHRRMVREAIHSALPAPRKKTEAKLLRSRHLRQMTLPYLMQHLQPIVFLLR